MLAPMATSASRTHMYRRGREEVNWWTKWTETKPDTSKSAPLLGSSGVERPQWRLDKHWTRMARGVPGGGQNALQDVRRAHFPSGQSSRRRSARIEIHMTPKRSTSTTATIVRPTADELEASDRHGDMLAALLRAFEEEAQLTSNQAWRALQVVRPYIGKENPAFPA